MALTKVTGDFIKDGVLTQAHLHTSHGITTAHIGEGSNLYFTNARVANYLSSNNYVSGTGTNNRLAIWNGTGVIDSDSDFYVDGDTIFTTNLEASGSLNVSGGAAFTNNITLTKSSGNNQIYINSSGGGAPVIYLEDPTRKWGVYVSSGQFYIKNETANINTIILNGADATVAGDLTVTGGDIVLGGTGRIQGIDTVSANTDAANKLYVDNQVAGIVDSAPGTLDTLNELAAALGDDANFSTTVTNSIAAKLPLAGGTLTGVLTGVGIKTPYVETTTTNQSLFLRPNGTGHLYVGDSGNGSNIYHYSAANDGVYTSFTYSGNYYQIDTTATSGVKIADNLTVGGNVTASSSTGHFSVVNASAYQLNGTYVMDSSRNLVNIANITSSGTGAFSGTVNFTGNMTAKNTKFVGGNSYNENIRMHPGSNDYSSVVLGAVSGDSGTGTGQWTLVRYPSSGANKFTIRHNSTDHVTIATAGNVTNHVDTRSPIFYDSNNTSYYFNGADTSVSAQVAGSIVSTGPTSGTTAGNRAFQVNTTTKGALHSTAASGGSGGSADTAPLITFTGNGTSIQGGIYVSQNSSTGTTLGLFVTDSYAAGPKQSLTIEDNGNVYVNRGMLQANDSVRGQQFYDTNNTSYYVDPTSTSVLSGLTVGGNTVSGFSGSWMGANFAGSRFGGYSVNGGEIAFLRDNPSSGKISVLVDGSYYAGENGGFWSIWSGNNYNNRVGIYGDSSGNLNIGTSASENILRTNHGYIQMGPMNTSHAHIYTDRTNFYFNKQIQLLGGTLINQNDIRAGVFYDVNNTGYYIHADDNSNIYNLTLNDLTANANIYGRSVNNAYSNLYKFGGLYLTWDSDSYGTNFEHSLTSSYGGTYGDDITLNSFHRFRINIDSNNNNGVTTETFEVGHNTTGSSNLLLKLDGNGHMTVGRSGLSTSQIKLLYNDSGSGAGWDTGIYIGPSGQLPNSSSFPTYTAAGGYGIQFQANSDGVFYGMKEYTSGHYRPFINWGDDAGDTPMEIAFNGTTKFTLSYDGVNYATASHRAPIFYDSNDTTYYIDPNSSSQSGLFKGNLRFNNYGAGIVGLYSAQKYQLVFAMGDAYKAAIDGSNVSGGYGLWYSHPNAGGVAANLSSHGLMNIANGQWHASFGNSTRASSDMRAPIFYDLDNTNYYTDPGGTNVVNNMSLRGTLNLPANSPGVTHGSGHRPAYGIYQEGGSWSHPFPDLVISMHTGIKMGANASYGGIRFYSDYQMSDGATELMSINNSSSPIGSSHVYVNNILQAGTSLRAPYYYDSDNTAYYINAASTSVINGLTMAGALQTAGSHTVGSSGTSNIYMGGVSGNYFRFHTNNSHTYFDGNVGDIHWRQGSSTRFIFYMTTANMTVNGTVTQNSDERIKENIITIDSALNKVNQLRGVYYNRTDINTSQKQIGLIAQEVENVIPEAVLTANDELGTKSISYGQINALLIEAIKEQQTIIDDLKSRIETLENQ